MKQKDHSPELDELYPKSSKQPASKANKVEKAVKRTSVTSLVMILLLVLLASHVTVFLFGTQYGDPQLKAKHQELLKVNQHFDAILELPVLACRDAEAQAAGRLLCQETRKRVKQAVTVDDNLLEPIIGASNHGSFKQAPIVQIKE